jgi:hypothetical protein
MPSSSRCNGSVFQRRSYPSSCWPDCVSSLNTGRKLPLWQVAHTPSMLAGRMENHDDQTSSSPSPPVRHLGMHRGLLQDWAVLNHSGCNISEHINSWQREADRDGRDVPWYVRPWGYGAGLAGQQRSPYSSCSPGWSLPWSAGVWFTLVCQC